MEVVRVCNHDDQNMSHHHRRGNYASVSKELQSEHRTPTKSLVYKLYSNYSSCEKTTKI